MSSEEPHNAEKQVSIVSSGHSQSVESHILSEDQEKGEHLYSVTTTATSDVASLATSPLKKFYFWQYNGPSGVDLDAIATQPSVFDDPVKAKYYQPRADYENLHRFDPSATWTWREEIVDYNNCNTIFTVCFLISELPSQLVSKQLGPDRWVPMQMVHLVRRRVLPILAKGGLPSSVAGIINMLLFTYLSQRYNQRAIMGFLAQVWILPTLIALESFGVHTNRWSKYATTIVLLSHPSTHVVQVGWTSQNSNSVRTRTVASALYNISVQFSGIIGNYIYRADDKPLHKRGNKVFIGLCCMNMGQDLECNDSTRERTLHEYDDRPWEQEIGEQEIGV
ncbi:hypothetical protein V1515DRAFT_580138 [Lipomyces mesembrius]